MHNRIRLKIGVKKYDYNLHKKMKEMGFKKQFAGITTIMCDDRENGIFKLSMILDKRKSSVKQIFDLESPNDGTQSNIRRNAENSN